MSPLVSVLLPAYNAAATVARAIASIRVQDTADWELIVVDDGSTDDTAAVALAAAQDDDRIQLVRVAHGGVIHANNAGLAGATGRFIARLDADDEAFPARLRRQVELLDARPELGGVGCLVEFGGSRDTALGYALHVDWVNGLREPDAIARARFIESPLVNPSMMVRREIFERHGSYEDTAWPEDYAYWLKLLDAGVRFAKVPDVLLRWNDPLGRLTRNDARYSDTAFYGCKCHYLARWLQREIDLARPVWLWGAGRVTRKRFAALAGEGVKLAGFIDIDARKTGRPLPAGPVIAPGAIPPDAFVVVGVGSRGARELIQAALMEQGRREGRDYILAA